MKTPPKDDEIRCRIFDTMRAAGLSTKELSRRIPKGETYIFQYLFQNSPKVLPEEVRYRLADLLGIDETLLRHTSVVNPRGSARLAQADQGPGPGVVPVLGRVQGTDFERMVMQAGDILGWEARPSYLGATADAYSVDVAGTSMEHRHRPGERLFVAPGSSPAKGDSVVVQFSDDTAIIKEFVGISGDTLTLHQFNPEKDVSIPLSDVRSIHVVVGTKLRR